MEVRVKDWTEVWRLPLHCDKYCPTYAYSENGTMALTFCVDNEDFIKKFVATVNGERESKAKPGVWHAEGCDIYAEDKLVCFVRGWGHLTGCGGLNLPAELAAKIQDGFVKYIIDRLNGSKG